VPGSCYIFSWLNQSTLYLQRSLDRSLRRPTSQSHRLNFSWMKSSTYLGCISHSRAGFPDCEPFLWLFSAHFPCPRCFSSMDTTSGRSTPTTLWALPPCAHLSSPTGSPRGDGQRFHRATATIALTQGREVQHPTPVLGGTRPW